MPTLARGWTTALALLLLPAAASAESCTEPLTALFERLSPAVVSIQAMKINKAKPQRRFETVVGAGVVIERDGDRKSTRLNSSHVRISYAVFCLKKKNRRGSR